MCIIQAQTGLSLWIDQWDAGRVDAFAAGHCASSMILYVRSEFLRSTQSDACRCLDLGGNPTKGLQKREKRIEELCAELSAGLDLGYHGSLRSQPSRL